MNRLHNRNEPSPALFWALGIVLKKSRPLPFTLLAVYLFYVFNPAVVQSLLFLVF